MATAALKSNILKFQPVKFNKIQNKTEKRELFQLEIGHKQYLK